MATIFEKKRGDCSSSSGECFDKISSDNKDYLLPQFAYKYNLVSWLSFGAGARGGVSANSDKMCQMSSFWRDTTWNANLFIINITFLYMHENLKSCFNESENPTFERESFRNSFPTFNTRYQINLIRICIQCTIHTHDTTNQNI